MLLAYESVVSWQCRLGIVENPEIALVIELYCGVFLPFIKNESYQSAREQCVPLYMNIIFIQSVYRSIRIGSLPSAVQYIPLSVQQLLFESLQILLPYVVSRISCGEVTTESDLEASQPHDLKKLFVEVFTMSFSIERPSMSVSSSQESFLCFSWLYLASLPISASGTYCNHY